MDDDIQRYLDGITFLLGVVAGELFALGLPPRLEGTRWLWGLGFGGVFWALVAAYQQDVIGENG